MLYFHYTLYIFTKLTTLDYDLLWFFGYTWLHFGRLPTLLVSKSDAFDRLFLYSDLGLSYTFQVLVPLKTTTIIYIYIMDTKKKM